MDIKDLQQPLPVESVEFKPHLETSGTSERVKTNVIGKETFKGIAQGMTVPAVTTPVDTFHARLVSTQPGKPTPKIKDAFNGYGRVLSAVVPQKMLSSAIFMTSVPLCSSLVEKNSDNQTVRAIAPYAGAAMIDVAITAPIGRIVQKLRLDPALSFKATAAGIVKIEGVKSLYRGAGPLAISSAIYNTLLFSVSKQIKAWIETDNENVSRRQALANSFAAGCATSVLICPFTYPIHRVVIDQRNQTNDPKSFLKTARALGSRGFLEAGLKGIALEFYRGIGPVFLRMPLMGGTMIATGQSVEILDSYIRSLPPAAPLDHAEDMKENAHI